MGTPDEKYKFTEKERDNETGLDYFGARFYDSEIGRWLAVDPLNDKYPGWSPFNYTANNPLNYIDPNGMEWFYYTADGDSISQWHYHENTTIKSVWNGEYDKDGNKIMELQMGFKELLTFDGSKLEFLAPQGKKLIFAAVSGVLDYRGMTQSDKQNQKNYGPIPEDWYTVDPRDPKANSIWDGGNLYDALWWTLKYKSWGSAYTPIRALDGSMNYRYGRNNGFIHGGCEAGSIGCIDLTFDNAGFHYWLNEYNRKLWLQVKYNK